MATLAAVVVTALMMWFLDRFSPYSARNNRQKYGPNARIFTLKESFWYAVTQITPEGKIYKLNIFTFLTFPLKIVVEYTLIKYDEFIQLSGGGETPKSVSGKVLVAAYWLFVVLMVSTFTSNLAAFLTVERMQATGEGGVKNLDMLADQSRIGYTLLKHSGVHEYFKNMAGAEDELYG